MDFDTIISMLFLLAFFLLPGIIKRVKEINTKNASPAKANKKPSVFNRISEKIQQFVQELEQQARQQKQVDKNQESPWDTLAEDQTPSQDFEISDQEDDYFREPDTTAPETEIPAYHAAMEKPEKKIIKRNLIEPVIEKEYLIKRPGSENLIFKSNPLQNAIIWSEILGKPVGLRE